MSSPSPLPGSPPGGGGGGGGVGGEQQHASRKGWWSRDPAERESAVMLIKAIIGAAALVFPRCFQRAGVVPSTVALVVAGFASVVVGDLLMETRRALAGRGGTFRDMAVAVSGSAWGGIVLDATVTLQSFGTLVGYVVACGDLVSSSLRKAFLVPDRVDVPLLGPLRLRAFSLLMLSAFVFFPLCLLRRLESLQTMAASTIVIYAFFLVVLFKEASTHVIWGDLAHVFQQRSDVMPTAPLNWFDGGWEGMLKVLPIIALSYSCVPLMIEVRRNLERRVPSPVQVERSWQWVSHAAFGASGFFYIATGLLGYTAFRGSTHANVLSNLETLGLLATTVNILFAASLIISYPLICFVVREPVRRVIYSVHHMVSAALRWRPPHLAGGGGMRRTVGSRGKHESDDVEASSMITMATGERLVSSTTAAAVAAAAAGAGAADEHGHPSNPHGGAAHHPSHDDVPFPVFALEALVVTGGTFVAAVAVPGIDVVLELIGGTAAVVVSYVIPVSLFFVVRPHSSYQRDKVKAAVIGIAGVWIGVLTCWNLWRSLYGSGGTTQTTTTTSPPLVALAGANGGAGAAAAAAGGGVDGESMLSS